MPTSSTSEKLGAAVLASHQSAVARGHHLVATGVTWSGYARPAVLRESFIARGLEDVMMVDEPRAAAALAQAAGQALGYDTTALIFVRPDTVTVSAVDTADGSTVHLLSRRLEGSMETAVLAEIAERDEMPLTLFSVSRKVSLDSTVVSGLTTTGTVTLV